PAATSSINDLDNSDFARIPLTNSRAVGSDKAPIKSEATNNAGATRNLILRSSSIGGGATHIAETPHGIRPAIVRQQHTAIDEVDMDADLQWSMRCRGSAVNVAGNSSASTAIVSSRGSDCVARAGVLTIRPLMVLVGLLLIACPARRATG